MSLQQAFGKHRVYIDGDDPRKLFASFASDASERSNELFEHGTVYYKCVYAAHGDILIGQYSHVGRLLLRCEKPCGQFILLLPLHGTATLEIGGERLDISKSVGAIIDGSESFSVELSTHIEQLVLVIDRDAFCRRLATKIASPVSGRLLFSPEIDLSKGCGAVISTIAKMLTDGLLSHEYLRNSPLGLTNLAEALMQMLFEAFPHRFSTEVSQAAHPMPRHVKKAIRYMRENLAQSLTAQEIATACGVSKRTLQAGFQQFKSTTPMAFLRHLRLDALHHELTMAEQVQSVGRIARRCGFMHTGRLAADYNDRFGQLPSDTIRNRPIATLCRNAD